MLTIQLDALKRPRETSVNIVGDPAKIQTEHVPNTSPARYSYTSLSFHTDINYTEISSEGK